MVATLMIAISAPTIAALPITVRGGDASEIQEQADGGAIHRRSGIRFPKLAGSMQLGKLIVYGEGDASVVYYASGEPGDTLLSFYVYPARQSLDAEQETVANSVEQAWTAKRIDAPVTLDLPADARLGWYDVRNDKVAGRSVYVVVRRGDWFLKARATIPHDAGATGLALAQSSLSALPWGAIGAQPRLQAPPIGRARTN